MGSYIPSSASGSKPSYSERESSQNRYSTTSAHLSLRKIVDLLEKIEEKENAIDVYERKLEESKRALENLNQELVVLFSNLDPKTKDLLSGLTSEKNNNGKKL